MRRLTSLLDSVFVLITFAVFVNCTIPECKLSPTEPQYVNFPPNFKIGVATAAYQIEGGWNDDGKGPSIWDTFTHEHPELIFDHSTGDVAADSYHRFDQDLAALKQLKVNVYRFSISWPRILPNGDLSSKNQKGLDYYDMIIDKLLENNIQPMVTMYHYDMPEELHKFGGFSNETFIQYFEEYAKLLFETYGDRVKYWITFNEPYDYCLHGYGTAMYPPMINEPGVGDYLCMDTTVKAHSTVYRLYKKNFFEKQRGKIGMAFSSPFYTSKSGDPTEVERAQQYRFGIFAHPLFTKTGNYPKLLLDEIAENSLKEGRSWTRLKPLNEEWLKIVTGACDFLGLNYYSSQFVEPLNLTNIPTPSNDNDVKLNYTFDLTRRQAKSEWLFCIPEALEAHLKWIRNNYNNIEVFITENGWSDDGQLHDQGRIDYLKSHIQAVLNAVYDGCNISGYIVWSLLDNFEWLRGYSEKFGLYSVNMTSPEKERIAKDSARYFRSIIENGKLL